jgi:hypothetical protein
MDSADQIQQRLPHDLLVVCFAILLSGKLKRGLKNKKLKRLPSASFWQSNGSFFD